MKYLFKAVWRKYFIILISIVLISSLGSALLTGLYGGVDSAERSLYNYVYEHNYPDVQFTLNMTDNEVIDGLINEKGVKSVRTRLSFASVLKCGEKILSVKASTYSDLKDFHVVKDSDIDGLLVEKRFAENNGVDVGDKVLIKVVDEYRAFTVGKIISSPEAVVSSPVRSMWAETEDFGNVYFSQKILADVAEQKKSAAIKEISENEKLLDEKSAETYKAYSDFTSEAEVFGLYLLEISLSLSNLKSKINAFFDGYDDLSPTAQRYLTASVNTQDAQFSEKYKDALYSACRLATRLETYKLFEDGNDENTLLKSVITAADNSKAALYVDYQYIFDENTVALADSIANGAADTSGAEYAALKDFLNKYGVFGTVTDENISDIYFEASSAISRLYDFYEKQTFDGFYDLYLSVAAYAPDLKGFYNGVKQNFPLEAENVINSFDNEVIAGDLENAFLKTNSGESAKDAAAVFFDIVSSTNTNFSGALNEKRQAAKTAYQSAASLIESARNDLIAARRQVESSKGYDGFFNELLIVTEDGVDNAALYNYVKEKYLSSATVSDGFTFDGSPIKSYITLNIMGVKALVYIVPTTFYALILLVVFLLVSLIIKRAGREIGTLRLLGYSTGKIRRFFCLNGLLMTTLAIVVGLIIGHFLSLYICGYYADYLNVPALEVRLNFPIFIMSAALSVVAVQLSTLTATARFDRITPMQVISNDLSADTSSSPAFDKVVSHFKPIVKFNIKALFKHKGKLVLSVICSAAAVIVIFTSLAYSASKDYVFDEYFNKRINYDAQVFLSDDADKFIEKLNSLDYVKAPSPIDYYTVTLSSGDKSVETVFNYVHNKDYIRIYDRGGNVVAYPENGVVMESHIADSLGLKLHDNVVIDGLSFEITAISFQTAGRVNYLSYKAANKLSVDYRAVLFDIDKSDHARFIKDASVFDGYVYTMFVDEIKAYNKTVFDNLTMPSVIMIIFAVVAGFIIIVNINAYELIDQKRKLCIFKSLGFSYHEISKNKFIQSLVQWLLAVIIGLPLGVLSSVIILKYIGSSSREYVYASGIIEFIISLGLTFLYTLISHVVCMLDFKNTDITKEIKDKD